MNPRNIRKGCCYLPIAQSSWNGNNEIVKWHSQGSGDSRELRYSGKLKTNINISC